MTPDEDVGLRIQSIFFINFDKNFCDTIYHVKVNNSNSWCYLMDWKKMILFSCLVQGLRHKR